MRKRFILIAISIILFLLVACVVYYRSNIERISFRPTESPIPDVKLPGLKPADVETVAQDLSIPWDVAFLPDGDFLVTERTGTFRRIGASSEVIPIGGVRHAGEGGLLGIALHPKFSDNHWLYLYQTSSTGNIFSNRVIRYRYEERKLVEPVSIISDIPGAIYHDGGQLAFGQDGYLYITTGDAGEANRAQDLSSLAGKILRLKDDGSIPSDNPFGTAVYSYGHRNSQGLAWDGQGRLWATEHGRSGIQTGYDELNRIEKGKNYGWPVIQGDARKAGMESPVIQSGPETTWAPAGISILGDKVYFTGLRGESLYQAEISSDGNIDPASLRALFRGKFGRLRALELGPDGFLYLTTSNTDGRGSPQPNDDKLIRLNPASFGSR